MKYMRKKSYQMSYLHIYKQSVQIFIHMQRFTVITFSILQSSDIKILRYGMKYTYFDIHDCAKICLNKTLKKTCLFRDWGVEDR